jgi:hypothetical protein
MCNIAYALIRKTRTDLTTDNNMNGSSHKFCIAPMMDWTERFLFSMG